MRAPEFWYPRGGAPPSLAARLLAPAAYLYDRIARFRAEAVIPHRASVPVICVGNLTAGGTGKTPVALAIAGLSAARGLTPVFLTRGYGGREAGPLRVDLARHGAADVGDEPLLLARAGPTIVSRARPAGAEAAVKAGASVIIMDDGFQNPSLAKDLGILVIDAGIGFGNGCVIPAGPLREPIGRGLSRAAAVVLVGAGAPPAALSSFKGPVLRAYLTPEPQAAESLRGRTVLAFAGIGRPEKFFESLKAIGAKIAAARSFPDHHPYTQAEIAALRAQAGAATLVTTEKDFVRLGRAAREGIKVLPVRAVFDDSAPLDALLSARAEAAADRAAR